MSIEQYLRRYAQPEISLAHSIDITYDHVVVVPAFDEAADFVDDLRATARDGACLIIVVVNATDDAPAAAHAANAALLDALGREGRDVLAIDRATVGKRLPPKHGVGLARRIGCDVALALGDAGKLRSPWIHTTDADATLPAGYFAAAAAANADTVALTYPFEHAPADDPHLSAAAIAYDTWLRYYVEGLRWAGSPYAFHSIGSTIAVRAEAYAAVRGFPLRQAGEDFYLLNKLAKVGSIASPHVAPVKLSTRASTRVPFGTGPGIAKLAAGLGAGNEPRFYDPRSFAVLRELLAALERFAISGTLDLPDEGPLAAAAGDLGVRVALDRARRATTSAQALRRRTREWFDGFRTRQMIHALRRRGLSDVPMSAALSAAPFWPVPVAR